MSNMYKGVKPTNELGGRCLHKCQYCSTESLRRYPATDAKYSGEYRIYESELKKNYKNKILFICGQNDLFEASVPTEIIETILARCRARDTSNLFMFQSKNPVRFKDFIDQFPADMMLGTTIETNREDYIRKFTDAPNIRSRIDAMAELKDLGFRTYLTVEPSLDFDVGILSYLIKIANPDKVYIGADSKVYKYPIAYDNLELPEPSSQKVKALISELWKFTEVEQKSNLARLKGAEA